MIDLFEDHESGGFFSTSGDDPNLVMRIKDDYDGAEPSGNALAALDLLRLASINGNTAFRESADRALQAFARKMSDQPAGLPQMLVAWEWASGKPAQVIFAGGQDDPGLKAMHSAVLRRFLPHRVLAMSQDTPTRFPAVDGLATAYLCEDFTCRLPQNNPKAFESSLDELLK